VSLFSVAQINISRMTNAGRNALYFEDYVLAIQYFNQLLTIKPNSADFYFYRAVAKINLEDLTGAYEDCSKALEINPFYSEAYYCRGVALLNQKKLEEAKKDFLSALEFNPENINATLNLAITEGELNRTDEALSLYSDILRKHPNSVQNAFLRRGELYLKMQDTIAAQKDFDDMVRYFPYSAVSYNARAYLRMQKKDYKGAIEDCNRSLILDSYSVTAYINRALAYYFEKRYQMAMNDLDKAIELDPNNYNAYYNRALLSLEVAENNKAIEDFTMVLCFDKNNLSAYYNRAILRCETGNYSGALDDINVVLNKYPKFPPAYFIRAEINSKLGKKLDAEKDRFLAYKYDEEKPEMSDNLEDDEESLINYNKVVLIDPAKEKGKTGYKNEIRGRLQNRNIDIELMPNITLTFINPNAVNRKTYFDGTIDALNKLANRRLYVAAENINMSEITIHEMFSEKLPNLPKNMIYEAVRLGMLKDYSAAIEMAQKIKETSPEYEWSLLYIINLRLKEAEVKWLSSDDGEEKSYLDSIRLLNGLYEHLLRINPNFYFAWYNRANLYAELNYFNEAIEAYTKAISANAQFAEAYYNRGLVYLKMNNNSMAIADLSKAGELGMYEAYNVIKRYSK